MNFELKKSNVGWNVYFDGELMGVVSVETIETDIPHFLKIVFIKGIMANTPDNKTRASQLVAARCVTQPHQWGVNRAIHAGEPVYESCVYCGEKK